MNCDVALELISASLDGETTPEEERQLQEHLDQCPRCRAIQAELAGLSEALGADDTPPPPQMKEYILTHLPPQQNVKGRKVLRWTRWGAMAAAIALVALAAWRLPRSLFSGSGNAAPESAEAFTDSVARDSAGQDNGVAFYGRSVSGDDDFPTYVDGEGVSVNSVQANEPAAPQAPAPAEVSESVQGPLEDDALPKTKIMTTAATSSDAKDIPAASETPAPAAGGGGDAATVVPERRAFLFSGQFSQTQEEVDGAVPEDVPELAGEEPLSAEPFEGVTEDIRDFSCYQAVVTLATGGFESDEYPRQRQGNGEMWYLLPADMLDTLPQTLEADGLSCQVRTEGEDLTPDAQYVLLVVPGDA